MPLATLSNSVSLAYDIQGEGPPLVLICGLGTGGWIWCKQVPELAQHFQVITFDPRGVGESSQVAAPFSIADLAEDISFLLEHLGLERAHIVGASLGGIVAQQFALTFPHLVERLVLSCTTFGGPNHVLPGGEGLAALMSVSGLNGEERARRNIQFGFTKAYLENNMDDVEDIIRMRLACNIPEHVYLFQVKAASEFNAEPHIPAIQSPTLVISGNEDIIIPVQNSHNLAQRIPNARLEIVEGAGHAFFIERAGEFNQTVLEFLKGN